MTTECEIPTLTERQKAISDLYRWNADVLTLRAGGATDADLHGLARGLQYYAKKYNIDLEAWNE